MIKSIRIMKAKEEEVRGERVRAYKVRVKLDKGCEVSSEKIVKLLVQKGFNTVVVRGAGDKRVITAWAELKVIKKAWKNEDLKINIKFPLPLHVQVSFDTGVKGYLRDTWKTTLPSYAQQSIKSEIKRGVDQGFIRVKSA